MKKKVLVVVLFQDIKNKELKVLLLQRNPDEGSYWQSVTGGVEAKEDYLEAAIRECQEETGFTVKDPPSFLGLQYSFEGRWGTAHERCYSIKIIGDKPPTPTLDAREHGHWRWLSVKDAIELAKYDTNKEAIKRASSYQAPFILDKEGIWHQEGEEITHKNTIALLFKSLAKKSDQSFVIRVDESEIVAIIEDSPLFVTRYNREAGLIHLKNGHECALDKNELRISSKNILYTKIKGWDAKFERSAYYEISKDIIEDNNTFYLQFKGKLFPIVLAD